MKKNKKLLRYLLFLLIGGASVIARDHYPTNWMAQFYISLLVWFGGWQAASWIITATTKIPRDSPN